MAKKEEYFCLAEKMFAEGQKPISVISSELSITEKTLHSWKKEGNWIEKRKKYLSSKFSCYSGLYELLGKLTDKALADFEETGEAPERSTSNLIGKLIDKLPKLKNFESVELAEKLQNDDKDTTKDVNTDVISSVDKFLRGED